jgi:murein DD-endopeptidase MepM/ murein hydrolase activator NlpD
MSFPLSFVPSKSWRVVPRSFGAPRNQGKRKHAGCDLYAPPGTPVFAVDDGTVLSFSPFYLGSWAIVVRHPGFVVRYGETRKTLAFGVKVGGKVKKGQKIGEVSALTGLDISMVHFEMYTGEKEGPLTVQSGPFKRRGDLKDPTHILEKWAEGPLPVPPRELEAVQDVAPDPAKLKRSRTDRRS